MGLSGKNNIVSKDYKPNISPYGGYYYPNELWYSNSYQALSKSSRDLLHCLINELRWKRKKGAKKEYINNGEISFPESLFIKLHNRASQTYITARNQLIEVGFIKRTYEGGYCRGDCAKYKLLFIQGVPRSEQRWKSYPERDWKSEVPIRKDFTIGEKTRFKAGNTSNVLKATLKK